MSSFDRESGVIVLDVLQWDTLQKMISGPIVRRATHADGALLGLEDIGVIDDYGLTPPARDVLAGRQEARARYTCRRLDPCDPVPVRDIVLWLGSPRCTVERYDVDGVHLYACDDVDVPQIALANDHLAPRLMLNDGPDRVLDTLAASVRTANVEAAIAVMREIAAQGPRESVFVRDAIDNRWTMVLRMREELGDNGFDPVRENLTLGTTTMLYEVEEIPGPIADPRGPSREIPLTPALATVVWAEISGWMWSGDSGD